MMLSSSMTQWEAVALLSVDSGAVPSVKSEDGQAAGLDIEDDPVITHAEPPQPLQRLRQGLAKSLWLGVGLKPLESIEDLLGSGWIKFLDRTLEPGRGVNRVVSHIWSVCGRIYLLPEGVTEFSSELLQGPGRFLSSAHVFSVGG